MQLLLPSPSFARARSCVSLRFCFVAAAAAAAAAALAHSQNADEVDRELQLDVHEADDADAPGGGTARDGVLVLSVTKHVVCQDLKSREFVKYVVAGSMGGDALTWEVQRRFTDFRDLAAQLEGYQREHGLESVVRACVRACLVRAWCVRAGLPAGVGSRALGMHT
jgi:hypothetical protein